MEGIKLTLPWPPSGNKLWRHLPNRRKPVLAKDGKLYYLAVKSLVLKARNLGEIPRDVIAEPVHVTMVYYPPDRRVRDAGNAEKVIYDALTKAGLWLDDSLANNQDRQWLDPVKPGRVELTITSLANYVPNTTYYQPIDGHGSFLKADKTGVQWGATFF